MDKITEERLLKCLPHGSGIDCTWEIEQKSGYWKCSNSFHCMNDVGFYVGFADFSLIVRNKPEILNPKNPQYSFETVDFNLHFHGNHMRYWVEKLDLRDYLSELFAQVLDDEFVRKEEEG